MKRVGLATSGPATFGGAPPSARTIKYARMYHFEKKNLQIFSPEGLCENVWGPTRMFSQAPLWLSMGLVTTNGNIIKIYSQTKTLKNT